jgi:hypothetical protein
MSITASDLIMCTLEAVLMSEPRFRLVRGSTLYGISAPSWPTALDPFAVKNRVDGPWWSWRLLGANNRELGRGGTVHRTAQECREAIIAGQAKAPESRPVEVFVTGGWTWQCEIEGEPFAVAGRSYQRQRECRYSSAQFLRALDSTVAPSPQEIPPDGMPTEGTGPFPLNRIGVTGRMLAQAAR